MVLAKLPGLRDLDLLLPRYRAGLWVFYKALVVQLLQASDKRKGERAGRWPPFLLGRRSLFQGSREPGLKGETLLNTLQVVDTQSDLLCFVSFVTVGMTL